LYIEHGSIAEHQSVPGEEKDQCQVVPVRNSWSGPEMEQIGKYIRCIGKETQPHHKGDPDEPCTLDILVIDDQHRADHIGDQRQEDVPYEKDKCDL